jgi:hypothetical protein
MDTGYYQSVTADDIKIGDYIRCMGKTVEVMHLHKVTTAALIKFEVRFPDGDIKVITRANRNEVCRVCPALFSTRDYHTYVREAT